MHDQRLFHCFAIALLAMGASACTRAQEASAASTLPAAASTAQAGSAVGQGRAARASLPQVTVHKHASCGCCVVWVEHLREAGFSVDVRDVQDMGPIKARVGVPYGMGSCHTAEVGGYFVEGHVPAADILALLRERPQARGLALPGMPIGSPGMEHPDGIVQPYTVSLIDPDGQASDYRHHD